MLLRNLHEADSRRDLFRRFLPKSAKSAEATKTSEQPSSSSLPEPPAPDSGSGGGGRLIGNVDRRGFIRTVGGVVANASGIGPAVSAVANAADKHAANIFDKMSDKQLLATPEETWITQIQPGRAAHIAKKYPEHGHNEAIQKIYKILSYGLYKAAGVDPMVAKQISDSHGETIRLGQDALSAIGKTWKLDGTKILHDVNTTGLVDFVDDDTYDGINKFAEFIREHGDQYGIRVTGDFERVAREYKDEAAERAREAKKATQDRPKRLENRRSLQSDDEIGRWEDDGGATFESKLNQALRLI